MKRLICVLAAVSLFACESNGKGSVGSDDNRLTKDDVAAMGGVDDDGEDLCEMFDWYDDGTCDDFCVEEDEDCEDDNNSENNAPNNVVNGDPNADPGNNTPNNGANNVTNNTANNAPNNGSNNNTTDAVCGTRGGVMCADGEFCLYTRGCGETDLGGTCEPRPDACAEIFMPVCGCDGNDYGNECEAHGAGVSVASEGPCDGGGPCQADADCGPGEICLNGVCAADPGSFCGGIAGITCPDGEFCNYDARAMCGAADQGGTCEPIPQACPDVFAPVCGCDLMTYGNDCEANAAGVAVAYDGMCSKPCSDDADCNPGEVCQDGSCIDTSGGVCGGIAGLQCAIDEWCDYPDTSMCGAGDIQGICRPRPDACLAVFDPVCGCDGNTHSNSCVANSNGVDVMSVGACTN